MLKLLCYTLGTVSKEMDDASINQIKKARKNGLASKIPLFLFSLTVCLGLVVFSRDLTW